LAFLVYPSATHTRFAHAIGSCYLGFIASHSVAVAEGRQGTPVSKRYYLAEFLEASGWREEFYLALLLHDVGHYPFSHALENNKDFWDGLGRFISHEEAACQLIQGRGSVADAFRRRKGIASAAVRRRHTNLADVFESLSQVDRLAVCYLISGNEEYLTHRATKKSELQLLHELVSGLLDLDRVDHYRRDNFFTGLKSGTSVNYPGLLSGLTISYDSKKTDSQPQLRLAPHAVGHAISLLQTKERLMEDCFEHPRNLAFEVMLHHAFNLGFFGREFYDTNQQPAFQTERAEELFDSLTSTDEELLIRLQNCGQAAADVVVRIRNRDPYSFVAKVKLNPEHGHTVRELRYIIADTAKVPASKLALRVLPSFGRRHLRQRSREWLDLERLLDDEGRRVVDGKFRRQIEHFKAAQDDVKEPVWLFGTDEAPAKKLFKALGTVQRKLNCEVEETCQS
jgi:HD superfamily phosphohydrolase